MAFSCVSQQGEFKNTSRNFLGEVHVKNFWPKKLREKKKFFPVACRLFPSICFYSFIFYRVIGRFSARGAQKHHKKYFLKSDLKISKNLKKR
jgi:hypothetical protein